jgi:hypothetical protein
MSSSYRHEPLIAATRMTAAANLAILRTQASSKRRELTPSQATAAMLIAVQFERIVRDHARRRTIH